MGSSMVRMWCGFVRLTSSTMEARVVDLPELFGDVPERGCERVPLEVHVDAEAPEAGHAVGEVELPVHLELLLLLGGENAVKERAAVLWHHAPILEGDQVAVDANGRRGARDQVEV